VSIKLDRMDLFPVPVFGGEFGGAEELRKALLPELKAIESNDTNPRGYSANGYTNYNPTINIIDNPMLVDLREFIVESVIQANNTIGLKNNVIFSGSWFSINRMYSTHLPHNHIPSTWSGVYYVQATDEDAPLTFIDKNKECSWPWANNKEMTVYSTPHFSITPKTGRLIIFPAYLTHMVDEQKVDAERIAISFNMSSLENTND
jgi:uncharacterized protein (TIGR02466 family)